MPPYPDNPHFAFPFARDPNTGQVNVVEQDTVEDIMGCELVIASYPVGLRHDRPEFGWPFPDMTSVPIDLGPLETALKQFEPRGNATASQLLDAIKAAWVHTQAQIAIPSVTLTHTPTITPAHDLPAPPTTDDVYDGGPAAVIFTDVYDGGHASTSSFPLVIQGVGAAYPHNEDGGIAVTIFTDGTDGGHAPSTYTTIIDGG